MAGKRIFCWRSGNAWHSFSEMKLKQPGECIAGLSVFSCRVRCADRLANSLSIPRSAQRTLRSAKLLGNQLLDFLFDRLGVFLARANLD